MFQFTRKDLDGAHETLTIVHLDSGEKFHCDYLDRETPFLVQVTSGPNTGDDFIGLYDLDGERVTYAIGNTRWSISEDVPVAVVEALEGGWSTGTYVVERTP